MTAFWWFVLVVVLLVMVPAMFIVGRTIWQLHRPEPKRPVLLPPPPGSVPKPPSGHYNLYPDYEGRWVQPPELQHTEFKFPERDR